METCKLRKDEIESIYCFDPQFITCVVHSIQILKKLMGEGFLLTKTMKEKLTQNAAFKNWVSLRIESFFLTIYDGYRYAMINY